MYLFLSCMKDQGNHAWTKHLGRNRSVIVELFQGQQSTAVTCPECHHRSLSFDPFMSLSLPLPKQHEVIVNILLLRRMPRIRLSTLDTERGILRLSGSEIDERIELIKSQHK